MLGVRLLLLNTVPIDKYRSYQSYNRQLLQLCFYINVALMIVQKRNLNRRRDGNGINLRRQAKSF